MSEFASSCFVSSFVTLWLYGDEGGWMRVNWVDGVECKVRRKLDFGWGACNRVH